MSVCRVVSCVVGRGCLQWPVHSLGETLLAFALLHFVLQGQTYLLLQVSFDFLFFHSNPLWWKRHLLGILILKGLVGLHRTSQLQLFQLNYTWIIVMLNGLPWKWTKIILLFLKLYPNTAFWTLLLTMRAQFSSVQSLSHVWLFETPWTAVRQASLSITNSWNLLKLMSIKSVMPTNQLILCRLLLLLPSIFSSISFFQNWSVLCITWPKY